MCEHWQSASANATVVLESLVNESYAIRERQLLRKELFKSMDEDASGGLNLKELRLEMQQQREYSSEAALKKLFEDIDSNQDGIITFQEADQHEDANP